jgi:hypothetical protein
MSHGTRALNVWGADNSIGLCQHNGYGAQNCTNGRKAEIFTDAEGFNARQDAAIVAFSRLEPDRAHAYSQIGLLIPTHFRV